MAFEAEREFAIWQRMVTAQHAWIWEVVERLEVTVPPDLGAKDRRHLHMSGKIGGKNPDAAIAELDQLLSHQELCYWHICTHHGDPLRRGHPPYQESVDLDGHEASVAIVETGLLLIDVVMLGPDRRAAELIAADPRLHASASTRVMCCDADDCWCKVMANTLARADAILALREIEGILNAAIQLQ